MAPRDLLQAGGQHRDVQRPFDSQSRGEVVQRAPRLELVDEPEPLLGERQGRGTSARQRDEGWGGRDGAGLPRHLDARGEVRQNRAREEVAQRHLDAERSAQARHHLGRQERMPAQVEEMVVHPDPFATERLGPDPCEDLFDRCPRCQMVFLDLLRLRQRLAVDLAVGGQGKRRDLDEEGRHHVVRQPLPQRSAQRVGRGVPGDVGHQAPVAGPPGGTVLTGLHQDLANPGLPGEDRLDLAELDPVAPDLDLMVQAPEKLQIAAREMAAEVTGAVEALARPPGEGVRHEAFCGQIRPAQIATRQADAAEADLAGCSRRRRLQAPVEEKHLVPGEGAADGGAAGARLDPMKGRVHRAFGRAVEVENKLPFRLREAPPENLVHGLARGEHDARAGRAVEQPGVHQEAQLRGGAVQQVDFPRLQKGEQGGAVRPDVLGNDAQGLAGQEQHELLHRGVEDELRIETGPPRVGEVAGFRPRPEDRVLQGGEQMEGRAVLDLDPFGPACRSGGIDDVGEMAGPGAAAGPLGRPPGDSGILIEPHRAHAEKLPGAGQARGEP